MTDIDIRDISKYAPELPAAIRLYNWLEKVEESTPGIYFSRDDLIERGKTAGYSKNDIWLALKELEKVINCANFWDSEQRQMVFRVVPMTPEEKINKIEAEVWFERLGK